MKVFQEKQSSALATKTTILWAMSLLSLLIYSGGQLACAQDADSYPEPVSKNLISASPGKEKVSDPEETLDTSKSETSKGKEISESTSSPSSKSLDKEISEKKTHSNKKRKRNKTQPLRPRLQASGSSGKKVEETGETSRQETSRQDTAPQFADGPSLPAAPAFMPIHKSLDSPEQERQTEEKDTEKPAESASEQGSKEGEDNYFNDNSEDVLNPFSIESVKNHIHKLTAPDKPKRTTTNKTDSADSKTPAKKFVPPDPSKTPFTQEWNEAHGRRVLAIIGIMLLALFGAPPVTRKLVRFMTQGREGNETIKRIGTTTQLASKFTLIGVLLLGLLEVLREFQIDVGPMLTGAGIFGVALGFAGQSLLKDILAGTLIIIEEQIRVGDFVKIAGISGTVEEISLRKIQLRDFNGNMLYVPNSQVDVVVNMTREYSRYVIDVPVAYKEDFNEVVKVLGEIDEEIRADADFKAAITEPLTIYGLSHFGTNGYVVTVRTTTKPGEQWRAAREYRKRIKEKFDQLNIEIPVSQMTIHTGHDKQGQAEPISIEKLKS